jgi:hypothetical protein
MFVLFLRSSAVIGITGFFFFHLKHTDLSHFRLLKQLIIDVYSVVGFSHCVAMGDTAMVRGAFILLALMRHQSALCSPFHCSFSEQQKLHMYTHQPTHYNPADGGSMYV